MRHAFLVPKLCLGTHFRETPFRGSGPILLFASIAAYLLLFAFYYPPTHAIEDEVGYLNQALVWSKGSISAEGADYRELDDFIKVRGRLVGWRNPGRSLILVPFVLLDPDGRGLFWSGALVHVATTLAAALVLVQWGLSPLWAVLVLLHPTLSLYSRTVMADEAAGLFLLLSLWVLPKTRWPGFWSGLLIGLAVLCRYQLAVIYPFFALALWLTPAQPKPRRQALACLAAAALSGSLIAAYNLYVFDNFLGMTHQGYFSLDFLAPNLFFYGTALLVLWPGMLVLPWLVRLPLHRPVQALCFPSLSLLLAYYFHDSGASRWESVILGQRLLQSALPVWIVAYAFAFNRLWSFCSTRVARPESSKGVGATGRILYNHALRGLRACHPVAWVPWVPCFRRSRAATASSEPARRKHGETARLQYRHLAYAILAAFFALLLAAQCLLFHRHQAYLQELSSVRDEIAALLPPNSLVVANSALTKLFGVPNSSFPSYRFKKYYYHDRPVDNSNDLETEQRPWFLALLLKTPADEHPQTLNAYVKKYALTPLPARDPRVRLYRCDPN